MWSPLFKTLSESTDFNVLWPILWPILTRIRTHSHSHSSCNSRFILHASKLVFNLPHSATFYALLLDERERKSAEGKCYNMVYYECVNSFNRQCNDLIDMYFELD